MTQSIMLVITKRENGSKGAMNKLRKEGFLPGSISQKARNPSVFQLKMDELSKAISANGMSSIYTLQADKRQRILRWSAKYNTPPCLGNGCM